MAGIIRWLHRLWSLVLEAPDTATAPESDGTKALRRATHKTIAAATEEIEGFRFNTLIARLMEHTTAMQRAREAGPVDAEAWDEAMSTALRLTAPLAPHIAEELWERQGRPYSIHTQPWPVADDELLRDAEVEIVVQVNGRVRDRLVLAPTADEQAARAAALGSPRLQQWLGGREPKRVIYVPGKLLNIVV
jgi:leucyl-tRNA synthetase